MAKNLPRPELVLDSGAIIHVVGDARLLSNLRAAAEGLRIIVADGKELPVNKIGDILMPAAGFTIPGFHLAPGIELNMISVRELERSSRICTWFDGDGRAMLYAGHKLVGVAMSSPEEYGLYVLQFLNVPTTKSGLDDDGEMRLVPVWCGSTAHTIFGSVLCWLKAFLLERLFGSVGPEVKPIPEPEHGSSRIRREPRRRKKGKKNSSGRKR